MYHKRHQAAKISLVLTLLALFCIGLTLLHLTNLNIWRVFGLNITSNTTRIRQQPVTLQQIQKIGELTAIRWPVTQIIPVEQSNALFGVDYSTTKLLVIAQVDVTAGINVQTISPQMVQTTENTVTITLPPPQILATNFKTRHSKIYDYNRGFLGLGPDVGPQLQSLAQVRAVEQGTQAACNNGILEQANNQAESLTANLLQTAYPGKTIQVKTTPARSCTIAESSVDPEQATVSPTP
ncbi:DUF4230 domain-containing protein [Leptolyngbya sp. AN03gr2]|uniref:DUF4230 domain-containing protein n=1 Tax=unclassified Leptolyngbya TaxID=2650499 RepID=UPI003D31235F